MLLAHLESRSVVVVVSKRLSSSRQAGGASSTREELALPDGRWSLPDCLSDKADRDLQHHLCVC